MDNNFNDGDNYTSQNSGTPGYDPQNGGYNLNKENNQADGYQQNNGTGYDQNNNYNQNMSYDQNAYNANQTGNNFNYTPQPNQPQQNPGVNGFEIASLVLGILSVLFCCCYGVLSICLGFMGIVFAILSRKQVVENGVSRKKFSGMSIAGLILSGFGILLGILFVVIMIVAYSSPDYQDTYNQIYNQIYNDLDKSY